MPRGAIDRNLFGHLIKEAEAEQEYALMITLQVQFGISCRGPSVIPHLRKCDVNLESRLVVVPRKGTAISKAKDGDTVAVPIVTVECFEALKIAVDRAPEEDSLLFRSWDADHVNRFIQRVAKKYNWNTKYQWSNHCLRHGSAMEWTEKMLDELRARGGCKCESTAILCSSARSALMETGEILPPMELVNPHSLVDEDGLPIEDAHPRGKS